MCECVCVCVCVCESFEVLLRLVPGPLRSAERDHVCDAASVNTSQTAMQCFTDRSCRKVFVCARIEP